MANGELVSGLGAGIATLEAGHCPASQTDRYQGWCDMWDGTSGFAAPIDVSILGSRRLAVFSAALHFFGAFALVDILRPAWMSAGLASVVLIVGLWSARRFVTPAYLPVQRVRLFPDGRWRVWCDGGIYDAELADGCLVSPTLTILPLRIESRRTKYVLLTTDNVDADSFRRLRVRLRYR
jgi:toxin CptA